MKPVGNKSVVASDSESAGPFIFSSLRGKVKQSKKGKSETVFCVFVAVGGGVVILLMLLLLLLLLLLLFLLLLLLLSMLLLVLVSVLVVLLLVSLC